MSYRIYFYQLHSYNSFGYKNAFIYYTVCLHKVEGNEFKCKLSCQGHGDLKRMLFGEDTRTQYNRPQAVAEIAVRVA